MPRDKSRKFLKQKFAQQHKKTAARKHEHDDDEGRPVPMHPLDDPVSKKQRKNKYAAQSHKKERENESGSDEEPTQWDNSGTYSQSYNRNKTSTEDIVESFESGLQISEETNKPQTGKKKLQDILGSGLFVPIAKTGATSTHGDEANSTTNVHATSVMSNAETTSMSENASVHSDLPPSTEVQDEALEQGAALVSIDTSLEMLTSKDSAERIEALEKLTHLLCRRLCDDYFVMNEDKLHKCSELLNYCLKRGDATEQCLALQTIALIAVSVQGDLSLFFRDLRAILIKLIFESTNSSVKKWAMDAFVYIVWLSDNTAHIQSTLQFLEKLWKAPMTDEAKAAASMIHVLPTERQDEKGDEQPVSDDDHSEATNGNNKTAKSQAKASKEVTPTRNETKKQESNEAEIQEEDYEDDDDEDEDEDYEDDDDEDEDEDDGDEDDGDDDDEDDDDDDDGNEEEAETTNKENEEKEWFSEALLRKLNTTSKTKALALQNWTWLISSLPLGGIASLLELYEPELTPLLHAHDIALRCAAGEALTLLITSYQDTLPDKDLAEEYELEPMEWNTIVETFITLREESDKKRKGGEMKRQRFEFREFVRSVSENWKPEVAVKFHGNEITLRGWHECIPYNRVKDIMKGGLQLHLMENNKLQTRLQIDSQDLFSSSLTKAEKEKKQQSFKKSARIQKESRKEKRKHKNAFRFEATDHNDIRKRK